ncbi:PREDICTED: uncharacterized protein LOC101296195 [Fragaria vesca subsp. vesca]
MKRLESIGEKFLHIDGDDVKESCLAIAEEGATAIFLTSVVRPTLTTIHRTTTVKTLPLSPLLLHTNHFDLHPHPLRSKLRTLNPQIDFFGRFLILKPDFLHLKGFLATCVFDISSSGECVAHRPCAVAPWRDLGATVVVWDWSSGSCSQWRTLVDLQIRLQKRLTSLDRQLGALFVGRDGWVESQQGKATEFTIWGRLKVRILF